METGEKLELENWKEVSVSEKKIWLRYQNWTLVSVPDTITWFWLFTNPRFTQGLLFDGAVILECKYGWLEKIYRRLGGQMNKAISMHFYAVFLTDLYTLFHKRNYEYLNFKIFSFFRTTASSSC